MPLVLAAADASALAFTTEQKLTLAGAWVLFFLVPAFILRAHAMKRGRDWKRWFVLTLVGSILGPLEYWEHHAVQARRAKRRQRAEDAATHEPSGPADDGSRTGPARGQGASGGSGRSP